MHSTIVISKEALLISSGIVGLFFSGLVASFLGPFFPREAEIKGLTSVEYGFIFGVRGIFQFLASVPIGRLIGETRPKLITVIATFLSGVSVIAFGCFYFVTGSSEFLVGCILIKLVESIGNTALTTGLMTILICRIPDKASLIVSWTEASYGIGFLCGPVIGGFFYEHLGYVAPFILIGLFIIFFSVFLGFILPKDTTQAKDEEPSEKKVTILRTFGIWNLWIGISAIFISQASITNVQTLLEPYVRPLGLSGSELGGVLLSLGVGYAIMTPISGYICHRGVHPVQIMTVGSVISILGFCVVGPLPILNLKPTLATVIVGLFGVGLGGSAVIIPGYMFLKKVSKIHERRAAGREYSYFHCKCVGLSVTLYGTSWRD